VRAALAACPFVVVSDCIADTDTTAFAHVKLPAHGWGEKDGTVTNSERMISRQRAFLEPPGEAKADWWALAQVAKRMGWREGFNWSHQSDVSDEFAAMTRFENDGARVLNLPAVRDYEAMAPFQWGGVSPFARGQYPTADGKARLVLVQHKPRATHEAFPLRLNTGRYRDHWHTMTRTGLSPKLSQHRREPLVEVHPDTALRMGLSDGGLAQVETAQGKSIFRVACTPNQRRDDLFVPIHWTDQTSGEGRAGRLPGQAHDPHSGQPGFKNTPARITTYQPLWSGFLVSRDRPATPDCDYWTRIRTTHGWITELAGQSDAAPLTDLLPVGKRIEMIDAHRGVVRSAVIADGKLAAALFISRAGDLAPRDWLAAALGEADPHAMEILAGRPATPPPDRGPVVCACFDIGMRTIVDAIAAETLTSVSAVGAALKAGTNCGSCRPAIARVLEQAKEGVRTGEALASVV
jgi:assimilatory nitrate reductase catalytic subunit